MKIRPVGAELFYADGRTERHDEANSRFYSAEVRKLLFTDGTVPFQITPSVTS